MSEKVDVSKLREGDVVLVRMIFECMSDTDTICIRGAEGGYHYVTEADILSVEPSPLKVGDRVKTRLHTSLTIVAVAGEQAWCLQGSGTHATFDLSELERAS